MQSSLKEYYFNEIIPDFKAKYNFKSDLRVPRLTKIILSMGLGNKRDVKKNVEDLTLIAGQKAVVTKAKKSISQFNVREGFDSGAKVTLRKNQMYHFLDRLLNIALLNYQSFPGVAKKSIVLNKFVTMSLGIPDKRIFSEIFSESIRKEGLNITFCSNAQNIEEFKTLIKMLGFPIIGEE